MDFVDWAYYPLKMYSKRIGVVGTALDCSLETTPVELTEREMRSATTQDEGYEVLTKYDAAFQEMSEVFDSHTSTELAQCVHHGTEETQFKKEMKLLRIAVDGRHEYVAAIRNCVEAA
jgi:hypothetical protein